MDIRLCMHPIKMTDIIKENILVYGLKWRILSMIKFKLKKEHIEFLKKTYPDNKLIQRVLSFEKEGIFEMDDENTYIDFMDYLDDESVAWMDENYDATPQTIMLESIRDDIFCQTN